MSDLRDWIPDVAMEALVVRRALQDVEDPLKMAADIVKETLPIATMSIAHLAIHSPTEQVRLAAAKYLVDRAYGDGGKGVALPEAKPAWERVYDSVLVEAENAKSGASESDHLGDL